MDIIRPIPWQISNYMAGVGGSYALSDYQFDYALGGIPLLSATRDAWPYTEGMAEIRKQQFDNFAEPGEQSLYGWWLRSQSNFSAGAGLIYQDPDNDNQFNYRFADSLGVDPWTNGELKLLKQPTSQFTLASSFNKVRGYVDPSGVDAAFYTDGTNLWKITASGRTAITNPSAGTQLDLANTGTRYFLLAADGIWSGTDTAAATLMYNPPAGTLTTGAIEFAKGRIVYAYNNSIYMVPINTGAAAATPAATYTHTDPNWVWTSITEGPTAIYASGRNSTSSAIHKFSIDFTGTTEIVLPTITAVTPTGETINTIYGYIGSFMGIATTKGFRVGEFDQNGDVVYGPLLFTPTGGCKGITGFDRFMWTGSTNAHDAASGLFRVDLGNVIQEQTTRAVRYAYARDVYAPAKTASVSAVTTLGASGRLLFPVTQDSIWLQSATDLYPSGYLKTGRIRYNTEEPKLYKFVSLRAPIPLQGTVAFSILTQTGSEIPYITYGPAFGPGTGDIGTPDPNGPQNWIALKFTLGRGSDVTQGGILNGWQVKALPGSIRQRLINHTFLLFDEEMDKGGQRVGTDGYARARFEAFKALARAGDVVVFQELIDDISTLVVIDDWKFTQTGPPGPNGAALGGYLSVVLRTVAES
jgi:hypothetical protein